MIDYDYVCWLDDRRRLTSSTNTRGGKLIVGINGENRVNCDT